MQKDIADRINEKHDANVKEKNACSEGEVRRRTNNNLVSA